MPPSSCAPWIGSTRTGEQRAVMYTGTGGGNEVDFAPSPSTSPATPDATTPVEGKWVTRNWRSEALVMRGRYGASVLAKNVLDLDGEVWAIPAPILATLLN